LLRGVADVVELLRDMSHQSLILSQRRRRKRPDYKLSRVSPLHVQVVSPQNLLSRFKLEMREGLRSRRIQLALIILSLILCRETPPRHGEVAHGWSVDLSCQGR
jgi:hypothetical protein